MPKVRAGHSEQKKQEILAAAKRVCDRKPLYSVTMKDIVLESGMSQGGVYKYFPNIDAVYVAILNEASLKGRVHTEVEAILGAGSSRWQSLTDLLHYLGGYIQAAVRNNGKIYFELLLLYTNEPARFAAVKDQLEEVSVLEYLQKQLAGLILAGVADKTFTPAVPLEDLFGFLMSSMNGITQVLISSQRASGAPHVVPSPDVEKLIGVLALSVRQLLGGR